MYLGFEKLLLDINQSHRNWIYKKKKKTGHDVIYSCIVNKN